ncbi:outer membrane protein [Legionella feeleii]|uniref:Opacity protein and related surface antigens n=1 Tax=Legionella feeleii TaxID=453 RepID=A0A378IV83_9GAMM|nr:outer membrane beta-barrel protein [Legionella feeleii]STX39059.1 Opacity protein and related surface antigens [Legionella feeleii]
MKKTSLFALMIASGSAIAGTMGAVSQPEFWYLVGGAGYSHSRDANITVDHQVWDSAVGGYSDDLGSAPLLFFGVGRQISDYFRLDVRGERRGDYHYSNPQTGVSSTPGFTGDSRIRKFKLTSEALMLNGWLDLGVLSDRLMWQSGSFAIQPFVGAGIGVNYSKVHDFHTIGLPFGNRNEIASVNQLVTGSEFAWRASAGLSAQLTERSIVSVGYNYFDGGDIPFPSYILSSTSAPNASLGRTGVSTPPWNGKFRANEVYAELRVKF